MQRWVIVASTLVLCTSDLHAADRDGQIAYLAQTGDYWQVWVVPAAGGEPRQVTRSDYEKATCSWFPDGAHLLVNSLEGRLSRVEIASGREEPIALSLEGMLDATVSPNGKQIAFSVSTSGSIDDNEIWIVDADGTDLERLTQMPWLQNEPRWSADGKWIYFVSGDGTQDHDIWRISPTTRSKEQLTAGQLYHFELAIAPNGSIAFSSNRSGNYEIYTQRDEEPAVQRTDHPGLDASPSYSPTGDSLVFYSTRDGGMNVWRLDAAAETPVRITQHEGGARSPAWGPSPQASQ